MSATTIKLDGELLEELKNLKPSDQSLSSLIRDLLHSEIRRRKMARAAHDYMVFLEQNPSECAELDAWSSAPLERDAESSRRRKGRS